MLRGEIILENGDRSEFILDDKKVRKLKKRIEDMEEFKAKNGLLGGWSMIDELCFLFDEALARDPDPAEETPEAVPPGEST